MLKKAIVATALVGVLAFGITGCGSSTASSASNASSSTASSAAQSASATKSTDTYESILDEYTAKIQAETPRLIDEYTAEAAELSGMQDKAKLATSKAEELAFILTEGGEKMATVMYAKHDDYSVYEEWYNKLNDVYMTEYQKIMDVYMSDLS